MKDEYCHCGKVLTENNRWLHEKNGCFAATGTSGIEADTRSADTSATIIDTDRSNHPVQEGKRPDKQRWSRESYNAYQREYMRKRRAK